MKKKYNRTSIYTAITLAAGLMWSSHASAGLINGDFSSGFTGWQGDVNDPSDPFGSTLMPAAPTTLTSNYQTALGITTLTTTDEYWSVALFQDFHIDSIGAGSSLELSLDLSSNLSDGFDFVFAQLEGALGTIALTSGSVYDITAWADASASLVFGIIDGDFVVGDTLTISNISITEKTSAVPEPSSLILIGAGLLTLRRKIS